MEAYKELMEKNVKALVDYPEEVSVQEMKGQSSIVLEVRVAKSDLGKVIGKSGRIVRTLRTLMSSVGAKNDERVLLHVIE